MASVTPILASWRSFKRQHGRWPILSVLTHVAFLVSILSVGALLLLAAVRRDWDVPQLGLVGIAVGIPIIVLWMVLARLSRSADLRRVKTCGRTVRDFKVNE